MIDYNFRQTLHLLCLELLSITPIIIILGNVIPPFPLKIHHIAFGFIFVFSILSFSLDVYKKWILYIALIFLIFQLTLNQWHLKGYIDFFFGPFVLILMLDILVNNRLPKKTLKKYLNRFYILLWIPGIIATGQYFSIIPIKFLNATYVNFAYINNVPIPRPNGFLYHGSELSILICFLALFQLFKKPKKAFWFMLIIIAVGFMTYFKALLITLILVFMFYLAFVNKGTLRYFKLMSRQRFIFLSSLSIIIGVIILVRFFNLTYQETGYVFHENILTGRGAIWNIFTDRIRTFTAWNYMVGNGMGSSFDVFADYATPERWWLLEKHPNDTDYDTHNAYLSVFINAGLFGALFIFYLFRILYNQVKQFSTQITWNKTVYFGVIFIPLLTIGITIPVFENAIFWICLGFLIFKWKLAVDDEIV